MRTALIAGLGLLLAFVVERGMLPQITILLTEPWAALLDWRLLAAVGIVMGLLCGEMVGLVVALAAALLFGLSQAPGFLGAAIVSFTAAAWLGGWLAHHFRFQSVGFSFFWLVLLLLAERVGWTLVRWFFFRNSPVGFAWTHWMALFMTALLAAIALSIVAPRLKRGMFAEE